MSAVTFDVNGSSVRADRSARRLSDVLRDELGLTATKVGCDAGDCGACTVLLDGEPVSACMTPVGRLAGRRVETLEGLHASGECRRTADERSSRTAPRSAASARRACWSSAAALLRVTPAPTEQQVMDALGGVLCRCTGYRKIIAAVMDAQAAERRGAVAAGRQGRGSSRAARRRRAQGGRHGRLRLRRIARRSARDPDRALAVPSRALPAGRSGRVRRGVAGGRRGDDRVRHRRPQPVRRDPGDGRSAGVRRAGPGGAVPGRGGRDDRRRARGDGGAGHRRGSR